MWHSICSLILLDDFRNSSLVHGFTFLTSARGDYIDGRNFLFDKISTRIAISRIENTNYNRTVGISKNSFSKNHHNITQCKLHCLFLELLESASTRTSSTTEIIIIKKPSNGPASLMVPFKNSFLRRSASFLLWGVRVIIHQFTMSLMIIPQLKAFLPRLVCKRRFTFIRHETVALAFIRFRVFFLQTSLLLYFQPSLDFCWNILSPKWRWRELSILLRCWLGGRVTVSFGCSCFVRVLRTGCVIVPKDPASFLAGIGLCVSRLCGVGGAGCSVF